MANLSLTYTLANGTTADATEVQTNFNDGVTYINARNSGSADWDIVSSAGLITAKANIRVNNGSVSTPAISFTSDTDTGIYGASNGTIYFTSDGVRTATFGNNQILGEAGSLSNPTFSFNVAGRTDDGMFSVGESNLGFVTAGVQRARVNNNGIVVDSGALRSTDGLVGTPSITFESQATVGLYRGGSNELHVAAGGNQAFVFGANNCKVRAAGGDIVQWISTGARYFVDGTVSAPSIHWSGDTTTGLYHGSGNIYFAVNSSSILYINASALAMQSGKLLLADTGSAALPGIAFRTDTNTGIFSTSADILSFATAGVHRWNITGNGSFAIDSGQAYQILAAQGTAAAPSYSFNVAGRTDDGMYSRAASNPAIAAGGVEAAGFSATTTAGQTRLQVYDVDNGQMEVVTVGAADSGGSGFKVLRIPN